MKRYRVEPFAVAADIYSASGHEGRGGWTWYTGAAGWMYRVTLERILGIRREGEWLRVDPCVPTRWPGYRVTLRIEGAEYVIDVDNAAGTGRGVRSLTFDGNPVNGDKLLLEPNSGRHMIRAVLGPASLP